MDPFIDNDGSCVFNLKNALNHIYNCKNLFFLAHTCGICKLGRVGSWHFEKCTTCSRTKAETARDKVKVIILLKLFNLWRNFESISCSFITLIYQSPINRKLRG